MSAAVLWHYILRSLGGITCSIALTDGWRKRGVGGSNGGVGMTAESAAQEEGGVLKFELNDMQVVQASDDFVPLSFEGFFLHGDLEFALQTEGEKGTKDMAPDRFIALVEDRPGFQDGFGRTEGVLHHQEHLVGVSDGDRVQARIVTKDKESVVTGVLENLLLIDGKLMGWV